MVDNVAEANLSRKHYDNQSTLILFKESGIWNRVIPSMLMCLSYCSGQTALPLYKILFFLFFSENLLQYCFKIYVISSTEQMSLSGVFFQKLLPH